MPRRHRHRDLPYDPASTRYDRAVMPERPGEIAAARRIIFAPESSYSLGRFAKERARATR